MNDVLDKLPPEFWDRLENKIRVLGEIYNPVNVTRLYPFLVSYLPAHLTERALMRAVERGIISIDVQRFAKDDGGFIESQIVVLKDKSHEIE